MIDHLKWENRCNVCGNPKHPFHLYIKGWFAFHVVNALPDLCQDSPDWLFNLQMWLVVQAANYVDDIRTDCIKSHPDGVQHLTFPAGGDA